MFKSPTLVTPSDCRQTNEKLTKPLKFLKYFTLKLSQMNTFVKIMGAIDQVHLTGLTKKFDHYQY